jgi:putative transposase
MVLKPPREHATNNTQTYFVTSKTWEGRTLFRAEPWARLFFKTLLSYRGQSFLLHEFVLMPDHFHLLITPLTALERAVQLTKGGFSFRAKKELGSSAEIWQRGFADHRIRDAEDYEKHVHYIHLNPVKKNLCSLPEEYPYSSAFPGWKLDTVPQGLKPQISVDTACGTAEAVPFQNNLPSERMVYPEAAFSEWAEARILPRNGAAEAVPFQNHAEGISSAFEEGSSSALKGHDFSRAEKAAHQRMGALAPERKQR